jgi:hypothetical protein
MSVWILSALFSVPSTILSDTASSKTSNLRPEICDLHRPMEIILNTIT